MKKLYLFLASCILIVFFGINVYASQYTVQDGDTMWLIAQKHGISVEELILANPQIENPNNIWTGLVINLPDSTSTTPEVTPTTGKESLTFLYAGNTVSYMKIIDVTNNSLKTVCPDYFDIDSNGNLLITPSNKIDQEFINKMHSRGIRVTPFISNHWDRPLGVAGLNNREALSTQVVDMINKYNLDGINIDIENVNEQQRKAYTDFTRLIREKLPKDKLVTVSVAANPKGWNTGWHGSYDYKALSDYSDYLMIMTYDESYYGGPAGPISSSSFFVNSIKYALNQGVPKEKIVTGIPFFGRYWKEGEAVGGVGITANDIEFLMKNYESVKNYNEATESANVKVVIKPGEPEPKIWGGRVLKAGTYDIWYDDLQAVKYKLGEINRYGVQGAGSWALGQENTEVWRFYVDSLNGNLPEPEPTAAPTPQPTTTPFPEPTPQPTTTPVCPIPTTTPESTPQPTTTPESTPETMPEKNLDKVIYILNNKGNNRTVNEYTVLTRGEAAVVLSELTYLEPEPDGDTFADTANYWGKGQINALKRRGMLYEDSNNFYPNNNIRKDDLIVILERLLVLPNTIDFHTISYKDVPLSSKSYNAISKLCYFNIVTGVNKNIFKPEANVTVTELATMLDKIDSYEYSMNPDKFMSNLKTKDLTPPNPEKSEPILQPR